MLGNHAITTESTTRSRLLAAGMVLIAERGFNGVSVGEIEAAAGLAPRRGGLYKHFPSKQALVEAAMEERIAGVEDLSDQATWFASAEALAQPRTSLRLIAQVVLAELDQEKNINQIIEKDGDRFPELRDRMRDAMVEPGFRYAEQTFDAWIRAIHGVDSAKVAATDVPAVGAVLLSALVHHRRQAWLLGEPPHGIDTERFIDAWVDIAALALDIQEIAP